MFVYQFVYLGLKTIKPIKDTFNICVELCSSHVFSWKFFTGSVE